MIRKIKNFYKIYGFQTLIKRIIDEIYSMITGRVRKYIFIMFSSKKNIYAKQYLDMLKASHYLGKDYVPFSERSINRDAADIKLIAFYLPQFHSIPENDEWWGRGFTEWTNVSKAIPQFEGHYQPHLPGELGFYDLRVPEIQRRQVELARNYGIHGFCFHYYWFKGKRLLERPLDMFMSDPEIDFPFCICWANENWTRRWDGHEDDILITQEHTSETDINFISDVIPLFKHKNYITIDGRPVILIYRVELLPDPKKTALIWRTKCLEAGLKEPYLIAAQTFGFKDPCKVDFDAAVEFPPHNLRIRNIKNKVIKLNKDYTGNVFNYSGKSSLSEAFLLNVHPGYKAFKTVVPGWDNEPRRPGQGNTFVLSSPEKYKEWLLGACNIAKNNPNLDEWIVFINAWNEWGEGAYLEPDRKFGYAYLQATADALAECLNNSDQSIQVNIDQYRSKIRKRHDIAVILHIFYPELWGEISSYLENLEFDYDLYVSISANIDFSPENLILQVPNAWFYKCQNYGRDMAPFLEIFSMIEKLDYKYICKIHTKKTSHREDGSNWRKELLDELLGSSARINEIKFYLDKNEIGIIAPRDHLVSTMNYVGDNEENIYLLAKKMSLPYNGDDFNFIAGSMYWFKPSAITPILKLALKRDDFQMESGQKDATIAHALERFLCLVASENGYKIIETGTFSENPTSNFKYATPIKKEYWSK